MMCLPVFPRLGHESPSAATAASGPARPAALRAVRRRRPLSSPSCARCAPPIPKPKSAWSSGPTNSPSRRTKASCGAAAIRTSPIRWPSPASSPISGMDVPTLCAALLHDTVEDTDVASRPADPPSSASWSGSSSTGSPSSTRSRRRRPTPRSRGAERDHPQDGRRDGARPARPGRQARRPPAQHAHAALPAASTSRSARRARRWRSTRRWPTGSA